MKSSFPNLIAPVFTPFNEKNEIDLEVIPKYAEFLNKEGIEGVLVNGTSGEGMSLSVVERKSTALLWMQQTDKVGHVMIQVGGAPLPDVLNLAKQAEAIGANSILCLPDLYMKPRTVEDLIDYLKIVGEAAPKTPLLYYHIPMFTNVQIHMGEFMRSIGNRVPTFVGIKFTSNDLAEGMEAVKANEGKYKVFLGSDTLMLGAYALGFDGSIATTLNMFPKTGQSILKVFKGKNNEHARDEQDKLSKDIYTIIKYGPWVPSMKAAMNLTTPINCGPVRPPMKNLSPGDILNLKQDLNIV